MAKRLFVGTSGWSYPSWKGAFYPKGVKPGDFLHHYGTVFDAVEVDGTYYRVPTAADCQRWAAAVPRGFRFALKFPKAVVHGGEPRERNLKDDRVWRWETTGDVGKRFRETAAELGPKLGAVLLQCPRYPRRLFSGWPAFLGALDDYLDRLAWKARFVLEVRNGSWLEPDFLAALRKRKICLAMTDFRAPSGEEKKTLPSTAGFLATPEDFLTGPVGYVRLLGDRYAMDALTGKWDRTVVDRTPALRGWASAVGALLQGSRGPVYVYANNHFAGHGPETVRELLGYLGEGG